MTSFNIVSRDTAFFLIQQKIEACKGQPVLMLADGLSSGAATPPTTTLILHRDEGGFGMEIDEDGIVIGFTAENTPAELAGVPVSSRITGVENTPVTTRDEILTILSRSRGTDLVFDFAQTAVTPALPTVRSAEAPSPVLSGSTPYTLSFFTSNLDGAELSPPSSAVAITIEGADGSSGERTFVGTQRLDFQPGEKVDFRFESADMGDMQRIRVRLAPAPNLAHNLLQAALADLKGESRPASHGGQGGAYADMGHLRRWHLSHVIVTNSKTMQTWTFPVDRPISEDPLVEVEVLDAPPTFQRSASRRPPSIELKLLLLATLG